MDYQRFVALRQPICDEFAAGLEKARSSAKRLTYEELEELAVQYRQVLHDHALARSRFPGTGMARRLEILVVQGTQLLQRDSGRQLPSLRRFLAIQFPLAMARLRPQLAVVATLFGLTALMGFSLTLVEPSVGMLFLPAESIDGLERGTLWTESIFAVTPGSVASTKIATNNISVLMTALAGGMLAGLGALWVICLNGTMLGSVIAMTARFSMAAPLLEFIAAHGPLEISLILVCSAAGLRCGLGLIQATDRPRADVLRERGRDALIVLMGCVPWMLILGLVEGFLSPSELLSLEVKVLLGCLLLAVFILMAWNPLTRRRLERWTPGLSEGALDA